MNLVLWVIQILLVLVFTLFSLVILTTPREKILVRVAWAKGFSPSATQAIGVVELLGAIGLVAPMLTGILPWLTPLAAIGLGLIMIGAIGVHLRHREYSQLVLPFALLLLSALVAYGRGVWGAL